MAKRMTGRMASTPGIDATGARLRHSQAVKPLWIEWVYVGYVLDRTIATDVLQRLPTRNSNDRVEFYSVIGSRGSIRPSGRFERQNQIISIRVDGIEFH